MNTTFNVSEVIRPLRHVDSMSLLSYRDALRGENLSVEKPKTMGDGETMLVGMNTVRLVSLIDVSRTKQGTYFCKGGVEDAFDHHIAVNLILRERGFTAAIDNPEITIELS